MQTIDQVQEEIVEEFAVFDDWMDKYSLIIEEGNKLEKLDESYKTPNNIIKGCQSRVWLQTDFENGKLYFRAESDAVIVKGLLALVLRIFSGRTPDEIISADLHFLKQIGLTEIRFYAIAYKAKAEQKK